MNIETGRAMPPSEALVHASSEDLLRLTVGSIQILAERNGYTFEEVLQCFVKDEENTRDGS